jgi:hypothetical protein
MAKTFDKKSTKVVEVSTKHTFPVWVVVRHTRAGDHRIAVYDDKGKDKDGHNYSRENAMSLAEDTAQEAANNYGHGSASVFKGKLIINKDCEQP